MNIRHTHCLVSPERKKIRFFEKAEHAAAEYLYGPCLCFIMPPTSKKLRGHIGFVLSVRAPVHPYFRSSHFLMHAISNEPCMLGFWNFIYAFLMEKQLTHIFSCPSYLPFWSYSPFEKIGMKSDTSHILWTVHARVLKFHIWIPHGIPLSGVMPLWKIRMKSCQQDISKGIWARGLGLGQLM